MKLSTERILTTHVGSLARPPDLFDMLAARTSGQPYDAAAFEARVRQAVADVVRRQADWASTSSTTASRASRASWPTSASGSPASKRSRRRSRAPRGRRRARASCSRSRSSTRSRRAGQQRRRRYRQCASSAPDRLPTRGRDAVQRDIATFKAALQGVRYEEAFLPAISVTNIESGRRNEYYRTEDEFLEAIARAIHEEYRAIVDAGFVLQIDDPRLSTYYNAMPALSLAECRRWAEKRVEFVNLAIGDIPPDRVRFHTCYSIDIGPRIHDMPLKDIVDIMLKVNAGAYSFEASNPRHEHEYHVWETGAAAGGQGDYPRRHLPHHESGGAP